MNMPNMTSDRMRKHILACCDDMKVPQEQLSSCADALANVVHTHKEEMGKVRSR